VRERGGEGGESRGGREMEGRGGEGKRVEGTLVCIVKFSLE